MFVIVFFKTLFLFLKIILSHILYFSKLFHDLPSTVLVPSCNWEK